MEDEKKAKPKNKWYMNQMLMSTGNELSIHGFNLSFRRHFPLIVRLFWLLLFLAFVVIFFNITINEVYRYMGIPKRVFTSKQLERLPFPSVSICNLNPYKYSEMKNVPELMALESFFMKLMQGQLIDFDEIPLNKHPNDGLERCETVSAELLKNGYIVYEDPRKLKGSKATIHCYATHNQPQDGSNVIMCSETENGNVDWNGGEAYDLCSLKKCEPIIANGEWNNKKVEYDENAERAEGTSAKVTCSAEHSWSDSSEEEEEEEARITTCTRGKWEPQLECKRECHDIALSKPIPEYEEIEVICTFPLINSNNDEATNIMETANINCDPNNGIWVAEYKKPAIDFWNVMSSALSSYPCVGFEVPHATVTFQEKSDEAWQDVSLNQMKATYIQTPNMEQKAVVQCDVTNNWIMNEDNGELYCVFQSKTKNPAEIGDLRSELDLLWVKTAGEDNSIPPMCIKTCQPMSNVENIDLDQTTYALNGIKIEDTSKISVGTTANVVCLETFTKSPVKVPECQQNGLWIPQPRCLKNCETLKIPNGRIEPSNVEPTNGTSFKVYCNKLNNINYRFGGNTKLVVPRQSSDEEHELLTCMENGQYDLEIPTCVAHCKPLSLENGIVVYEHERQLVGTRAKLKCTEENTTLIGDYQVTCQENGQWNLWQNKDPLCLKVSNELLKMFDNLTKELSTEKNPQALLSKMEELRGYIVPTIDPQLLRDIGHGLEMIKSCTFDRHACKMSDFETFSDMNLGNCHRYTAWDENSKIKSSTRPGPNFGLSVQININQSEYIRTTLKAGAHVIVHKRNQTVSSDVSGYSISMGMRTSLSLKYQKINRINAPKGVCIEKNQVPNNYYYSTEYSSEGCYNSCQQRLLINNCGCGDARRPYPSNFNNTCTLDDRHCLEDMEKVLTPEYLIKHCTCLPSCTDIQFRQTAHYALWPAKKMLERYCQLESNNETFRQNCMETFSRTNAMVDVYYSLIERETLTEEISYTFSSLLSDIGSQMGIWMGLSAITLIELIIFVPRYWRVIQQKGKDDQIEQQQS